jgi:hypothetical protein
MTTLIHTMPAVETKTYAGSAVAAPTLSAVPATDSADLQIESSDLRQAAAG